MLYNLVVAKRQNVNSSGLGAATDTCFTVLKMAEKMAIKKWHFQHRDGHTTQKVKKIVVSKTHFIKKYWSDFNKKNFDVKIEGIRILESYSNSIYTYLVGF